MKKIFLFFLIVFLYKASYSQYLPEERPEDLRITYTATKGLMNSGETIYLSLDSCYYETSYQDIVNRFTFFITNKDMNELYEVFNKYEVEKMSSKMLDRPAPERIGDNLLIQWGDFYSINIANSGNYILYDKWLANWKKAVKNIRKYAKTQIDDRGRSFTIKFDESMSGKKVAMYLNNEFLYDNTLPDIGGQGFVVTLAAVPGDYYLKVSISEPVTSEQFKLPIIEGTEINLALKGNLITLNP
ncbi:MAG: hypothetical protein K1X86_05310 [Ignavibacteria bacterium]|nr:hypothetical protein [Ignavibacteria bacterium]